MQLMPIHLSNRASVTQYTGQSMAEHDGVVETNCLTKAIPAAVVNKVGALLRLNL